MVELHSERLLLRNIQIDDLEDIFEYSSNPKVGPNAGWKPHETKEETLDIMQAIFLNQETVWGIILKENGKMVGSIGLVKDDRRDNKKVRMLGYAIGENYWGKGLMTEAARAVIHYGFGELKLDLISAYCYPNNQRSKKVLQKCGFQYQYTLKEAERLYDGSIKDNECYELTK